MPVAICGLWSHFYLGDVLQTDLCLGQHGASIYFSLECKMIFRVLAVSRNASPFIKVYSLMFGNLISGYEQNTVQYKGTFLKNERKYYTWHGYFSSIQQRRTPFAAFTPHPSLSLISLLSSALSIPQPSSLSSICYDNSVWFY